MSFYFNIAAKNNIATTNIPPPPPELFCWDLLKNEDLWYIFEKQLLTITKDMLPYYINTSYFPSGWTPLMTAVEHNNYAACNFFLQHGVNVNAVTTTKWSALHTAAKKNSFPIVDLLLRFGANPTLFAETTRTSRWNLLPEDVTKNQNIINLLQQYRMMR